MENHGKENYEKLNEHGKSKEKQGIIIYSQNTYIFLDYIYNITTCIGCEIYNKITIKSMFDSMINLFLTEF